MMLERKFHPIELKGEVDTEARTFEGYAAAIGNVDEGDDMIMPGAFTNTLDRVRAGKVKLSNAHFLGSWIPDTRDVFGKMLDAEEDDHGLLGKYYVSATPDGDDLLVKIGDGSLDSMSIGYETIKSTILKVDDKEIRQLQDIKLYEVGVVVFPMNPEATIDASSLKALVKHFGFDGLRAMLSESGADVQTAEAAVVIAAADLVGDVKAGRVLSATNRTLVADAIAALTAVLEAADASTSDEDDDDKAGSGDDVERFVASIEHDRAMHDLLLTITRG